MCCFSMLFIGLSFVCFRYWVGINSFYQMPNGGYFKLLMLAQIFGYYNAGSVSIVYIPNSNFVFFCCILSCRRLGVLSLY
jgi:hypothetical protein